MQHPDLPPQHCRRSAADQATVCRQSDPAQLCFAVCAQVHFTYHSTADLVPQTYAGLLGVRAHACGALLPVESCGLLGSPCLIFAFNSMLGVGT